MTNLVDCPICKGTGVEGYEMPAGFPFDCRECGGSGLLDREYAEELMEKREKENKSDYKYWEES